MSIRQRVLEGLSIGVVAATLSGCGGASTGGSSPAASTAASPPTPAPAAAPADNCTNKHDVLVMHMRGDSFTLGNFRLSMSGTGAPTDVTPAAADGSARSPSRVHVWQDMTPEETAALTAKSVAVRKAYLERPDGSYQFLCDIDPGLDMDKMGLVAAAVGVELPNGR